MKTTMKLNRIRIAPRKMRMVVDLVRGKNVAKAKDILRFTQNKGARILSKLLDSAVSSAKTLGQGDEQNLMVLNIAVDEGPKLKRWRARAKGSAYPIQKKVSHITLVLDELKTAESTKQIKKVVEKAQEPELVEKTTEGIKIEKPKFKAASVSSPQRSKTERGIRRFFRRKAI